MRDESKKIGMLGRAASGFLFFCAFAAGLIIVYAFYIEGVHWGQVVGLLMVSYGARVFYFLALTGRLPKELSWMQ